MIAIIKGGKSAEREVSLSTAKSVAASLDRQNIPFEEIDAADDDWLEQVIKLKPEVVILALHGPFGEDGRIQQIFEDNGIKYTGSGPEASAHAIDKIKTKSNVNGLGIDIPEDVDLESPTFPVVVKPNKQGSSYGVTMIGSAGQLPWAIEFARTYDENGEYIVEERIIGQELTCGIIDVFGELTALPLVEIVPAADYFDYDSKYKTDAGCQEICPAEIDPTITQNIQNKSLRIYKEFGLKQYARIDWILRDKTPYFLEINTLPGMTATSLIPKELAAQNISYDDFIKQLIAMAK